MTNIEKKIIRPLDAEELTLEQAVQVTGGTGESIMYSSDDIEKDDIHCCNLSHLE